MEKETKKTTHNASACEEYVVEELKQAKKENKELKQIIENLKCISKLENEKYDNLLGLVKTALSKAELRTEDARYDCVYIENRFVGLFSKDLTSEEDKPYLALAELIKMVQRTPKRD